MYLDRRLWVFTRGMRGRIAWAACLGLAAVVVGIARLALLGWLLARVFEGAAPGELAALAALVAAVMALRGALEYLRTMVAHETAARIQTALRRALHDKAVVLGPAWFESERSGEMALAAADGVEQLEIYFGAFLPTLLIAVLTPVAVFGFVVFLDPVVAALLLAAALAALLLPAALHRLDRRASLARAGAYADFGAAFLDALQGLATLKAFGQSGARAKALSRRAGRLAQSTRWVNAANTLGRGIADGAVAIGAAAALAVGAWRVEAGVMEMSALLMVLMMGVELFRPLRELRAHLNTGMMGQAAAHAVFRLLDARPTLAEAVPAPADGQEAPAIAFRDVSFAYPGRDERVHEGLSFAVAAGERVAVVGRSGAGKSSILRLLLRFHDPQAGSVRVNGRDLRRMSADELRAQVATVAQEPYLFHGSIAENLRFASPQATQEEMEAACRIAHIHDAIAALPAGYATRIGERGQRLSGGQRQRLAIARALLAAAPILVLDEALSSVDGENEAAISSALAGATAGRTVLMFAHRLSSVIDADRILVLEGGRIVEQGNHEALMAAGGAYRRLMEEQARWAGQRGAFERDARPPPPAAAPAAAPASGGAILRAAGGGWAGARALFSLATVEWLVMAFAVACGIGRVVAFIAVGALSALAVARLQAGLAFDDLLWWLAVAAPLAGALHWLESWFAHDVAARRMTAMRERLFAKLEKLAPAFLLHRRSGDLAAVATQDIETVRYFYGHSLAPAFVSLLVPAAVMAALLDGGWPMAAALAPFLALVAASPFLLRRRLDRLGGRGREALGELNAFTVDTIQGLAEIAAFRQGRRRSLAFERLARRVARLRLPFFRDLALQTALLEAATGLGGLAVAATGTAMVAAGALEAGLLPFFALIAMAAFLPVAEIAQLGRQLADTLGAARRLRAIEEEPVAVADGPGTPAIRAAGGAALALEEVRFRYPGRLRPALDGVSLAVPAGATVALVGPSGAGKTTLAHLLLRFWDADSGRILLDGTDIRRWRLDDLRRHIALVAQDTFLFDDTLRANILLARPDAGEGELAAAIERAALAETVAGLRHGLETRVGERGQRLSGGQRQRVAIARAFLKDAPVLILDEATSHLDAASEAAVHRALAELARGRTTVVIAHRLSTVRDADPIAVMAEGRIVEAGRHEALAAAGGAYARLVASQMAAAGRRRRR